MLVNSSRWMALGLSAWISGATLFAQPPNKKPAPPAATAEKDALSARDRKAYQSAADYSREGRGTAVLVMKAGWIIFEDYATGVTATTPHLLASGTKSFSGVMAQCAVEDGLFKLDDKVSDTLTEWKTDDRKKDITIRQLLTLTSGLSGGSIGRVPTYADAIQGAAVAEPGRRFIYGPIPFQSFGELMRRKLSAKSESVDDYLKRKILDPIGLKVGLWRKGADGNPQLPSGMSLTPREWAKFGELIRLKGKWGDQQLVSVEHLTECFVGTDANPSYGLTFWLNKKVQRKPGEQVAEGENEGLQPKPLGGDVGPVDLVLAAGALGQRCYVIPSLELVVVRQGFSRRTDFDDREFLTRLLSSSKYAKP